MSRNRRVANPPSLSRDMLVLETEMWCHEGRVRIVDFMPRSGRRVAKQTTSWWEGRPPKCAHDGEWGDLSLRARC